MSDFGDLGDSEGLGLLVGLFYLGGAAAAALGVYGLRKAGVTGKQAWLGVLAAPAVWYGWKAVATGGQRPAITAPAQTQLTPEDRRAFAVQPRDPVALKDLQLMDILGRGVV